MKTDIYEIIEYLQEMLDDDFDSITQYILEECIEDKESEKQQIIKDYDDAINYYNETFNQKI